MRKVFKPIYTLHYVLHIPFSIACGNCGKLANFDIILLQFANDLIFRRQDNTANTSKIDMDKLSYIGRSFPHMWNYRRTLCFIHWLCKGIFEMPYSRKWVFHGFHMPYYYY